MGEKKMSDQQNSTEFPPQHVARTLGEVTHDIVELAELQATLFKMESRTFAKRLVIPGVLIGVAILAALAAFPVGLAVVALALVDLGVPAWLAFLTAALIALAACTGSGAGACLR